MDERRQALGMTWAEVARDAGITIETLRAVRRGKNEPSGLTKRGLDNALQWEPGSVQSVLSGRDPRPIGTLPTPTAEMQGNVTKERRTDEEVDSPLAAQFQALLLQAQQRTEERLAELTQKFDEQREFLGQVVEEQREMIEKLRDERRGA